MLFPIEALHQVPYSRAVKPNKQRKHQPKTESAEQGSSSSTLTTLCYVTDQLPGIRRRKHGRGFVYLDETGAVIKDPAVRARIAALVIPPAWSEVWICADPRGHIQATGRDERGRKQFRYHADWQAWREQTKFERLLEFVARLPTLRKQVDQDLRGRGLTRTRVTALVVRLLDRTALRVGNPEYARQNESYGLTTLQDDHVAISGSTIELAFRGKSGQDQQVALKDRQLARLIRQCQEVPGQELFQFQGEDREWHVLRSNDVNEYIRAIMGEDFSTKDFRTWGGTILAARALAELGPAENKRTAEANVREAIKIAARGLGNTIAVCRKYYIHPAILSAYLDGALSTALEHPLADEDDSDASEQLSPEEMAVRALLRPSS